MTPADAFGSEYLDEAYIEVVVSMQDRVARNRAITRGYHELAMAMGEVVGRDNANWLCFGQWASAEAGRAIREESVPALLRPIIGDEVAEAVAAGNAAVFGDVAPPFIRFVRAYVDDPAARTDHRAALEILDRLWSHEQLASNEDLQRAFAAYTDAVLLAPPLSVSADPGALKRRAERMLVGNASIGAHEQIIAEPHVRAAVPGGWIVAIAATAHLGLRIPDGVLALNRDVPPPRYLGGASFPNDLMVLEDGDAITLARRFGQDLTSTRDSDAPDWEIYEERMGYIFSLLRAYQQDAAIFELPAFAGA
jgi:hypothetical protein